MPKEIVDRSQESIKNRILALLETAEFGQTIAKIARTIGCARATVSKYLTDLVKEGKITNRGIGSYKVFEIIKEEGAKKQLIENCYTTLLAMLGQQYTVQPWAEFENLLKKAGIIVGRDLSKIYANKFDSDLRWEDLDVVHLQKLVDFLPEFFSLLNLSDNGTLLEIIPPIGKIQSESIHLKIIDPKIFPLQAEFHYFIIAGIIEEFLSQIARVPIAFNIREISAKDTSITFELGFLDKLFLDFSVFSCRDATISPRLLLDRAKKFWNTYYDFRIEEYETNGTLHYRFNFPNNRIVEQKMHLNMMNWQFFLSNYTKYLTKAANSPVDDETEIPRNATKSEPYIIFKGETNSKTFWDSYITLSNQFHLALKYKFRFEKFDNYFLIYFESPEEFDTILTPRHEPNKEREFLESRVGPLSMQYYERRNQIIGKIAEIYTIKR